jgi:hypothetical protein
MKLKLIAPLLAAFSLMPLAQANDTIDIAVALIGYGNQSAAFACTDGTSLNAAFEIRADLGPTVVLSQSGRELYKRPRYLQPSEVQLTQAITGQAYDGSSAVTVFLKSPTEIESIELGYMMGRQFKVTHRCSVRSITYVK